MTLMLFTAALRQAITAMVACGEDCRQDRLSKLPRRHDLQHKQAVSAPTAACRRPPRQAAHLPAQQAQAGQDQSGKRPGPPPAALLLCEVALAGG